MTEETGSTGSVGDKVQDVASQAQEGAQQAAGKVQETVRGQIDTRTDDLGDRASSTSSDLRSVAEKLREEDKGGPADLADRAAEQVDRVGTYLSEADADRLLSDVEDFGRRRPLAVLAGGIVLGVAAARMLKASSGGRYESRQPNGHGQLPSGTQGNGTAAVTPPVSQRPPRTEPIPAPTPASPTTPSANPVSPTTPSANPALR